MLSEHIGVLAVVLTKGHCTEENSDVLAVSICASLRVKKRDMKVVALVVGSSC